MVKILILIVLYYIGVFLSLKIITDRHRGENFDYTIVFPLCALSWIVVFLLIGQTLLNKAIDFIRKRWRKR